jgi:ATP-dependent Lhr-like helicase
MLSRIRGRIMHQRLSRVSPLAVPMMLEIGREPVFGEAQDDLMAEAAGELIVEAAGGAGADDDKTGGRTGPNGTGLSGGTRGNG